MVENGRALVESPSISPPSPRTRRTRGLRPPWQVGQSGNPKGRPRGLFSQRTLRAARKRGEDLRPQIDAVIESLISKAAGRDSKGQIDPRKADLASIAFLRETIDGPMPKADAASASGGSQVVVIVESMRPAPDGSAPLGSNASLDEGVSDNSLNPNF